MFDSKTLKLINIISSRSYDISAENSFENHKYLYHKMIINR